MILTDLVQGRQALAVLEDCTDFLLATLLS